LTVSCRQHYHFAVNTAKQRTLTVILSLCLCLLACTALVDARADDIKIGDTREQVLAILGQPQGRLKDRANETLTYPRGEVILVQGLVTQVHLMAEKEFQQQIAVKQLAELAGQTETKVSQKGTPWQKNDSGFEDDLADRAFSYQKTLTTIKRVLGGGLYDFVLVVSLAWGLWHGSRQGLSEIALTMIGSLLILTATLKLYQTVCLWLMHWQMFKLGEVGLVAILAIAVGGYLPVLIIRWLLGKWLRYFLFSPFIDDFFGGVLGLVSTAAMLAWLNLVLMLTCHPSVQHQIVDYSWLGSHLIHQLPSLTTVKGMSR